MNNPSAEDQYHEMQKKYPRIDRGRLISSQRVVLIDDSWIGDDLPLIVSIHVYDQLDLKQVWSGHAHNVLDFVNGKKKSGFTFPNGDKHLARMRFDEYGWIILSNRQQWSGGGKWHDYYSTPKTEITKQEWNRVVEFVRAAHARNEERKTKRLTTVAK